MPPAPEQPRSLLGLFRHKAARRRYDRVSQSRVDQTGDEPHVSPFLRHAPAARWLQHSHSAGTSGAQRRPDDDELHSCPRPGARAESAPRPTGWHSGPMSARLHACRLQRDTLTIPKPSCFAYHIRDADE